MADLRELSQLSGEEQAKSAPKYQVPIVRLNGKKGTFVKISFNEDGTKQESDLGVELSVVALKVRRVYNAFSKDSRTFSNEHNSYRDKISVFGTRKLKDGSVKVELIDSGDCGTMRQKFQNLKMNQIIYCLLDGEIIKLQVKGKGLSNLFNYWDEFGPDEHIFQFDTILGVVKEESQLGEYYAMTFNRGDKREDIDLIGEKIKEIVDNLSRIDLYYAEWKPVDEEPSVELTEVSNEEIPVINEE